MTKEKSNVETGETVSIPVWCMHGDAGGHVAAAPGCPHCGGTGRVPYESDEYPPGTNACCCTCGKCRAQEKEEERK